MRAVTLVIAVLLSFMPFSASARAEDEEQQVKAIMAAENFLLLIDTAQYASSWDEAADFFKYQLPKEEWVGHIETVRPSSGRVVSRDIRSARYMTRLPGAPEGHYYVIEYQTFFADKEQAVETVTPMLEQDGKWRVSGYYIR